MKNYPVLEHHRIYYIVLLSVLHLLYLVRHEVTLLTRTTIFSF